MEIKQNEFSKILLLSIPAPAVEQKKEEIDYWEVHFALKTKLTYTNLTEDRFLTIGNTENQNLGLLSIASYLMENGIDVDYLAPSLDVGGDDRIAAFYNLIKKRIYHFQPDVIGLSSFTCSIRIAIQYAQQIKQDFPYIKTILGGPHANWVKDMDLQELIDNFDFVVRGRGEIPLLHLLKGNYNSPGICYKKAADEIVINPINFITIEDYPKSAITLLNVDNLPAARVFTSLGCRKGKSCIFCADINLSNLFKRSESELKEELLYLYYHYKTRYFYLGDENFFLDKERALKILDLIESLQLNNIVIGLQSRISSVDKILLERLSRFNTCTEIQYGIESGVQSILNLCNKGLKIDSVKRVCEMTKQYNLNIHGYFLVGLPGETHETVAQTMSLIEDLLANEYLDFVEYRCVVPFPGTPMWEYPELYGLKINHKDWEKYRGENPPPHDLEYLSSGMLYRYYLTGLNIITDLYKKRYERSFGEKFAKFNSLSAITEGVF